MSNPQVIKFMFLYMFVTYFLGMNAEIILNPSSEGTGNKLNTAKFVFIEI